MGSAGWYDTVLFPLKWAVAWIMVIIHKGLVFLGMGDGPGFAWILSIVGLTIFVRILIFPLFTKQIKASRGMQAVQPELKKIRDKYKGKKDTASRQAMQQETMALYKKHGTNPFSSCMPILFQMPVFFALFRVLAATPFLAEGNYGEDSIGPLTQKLAQDINGSHIFGVYVKDTLSDAYQVGDLRSMVIIGILILLMMSTQFFTMKQLTMKNMAPLDESNPAARMQKSMMYMMPLFIGVSGFIFQVGVLLYWFTTNLWTMGQQFYAIEKMPNPGSEAFEKRQRRLKEKYAKYKDSVDADFAPRLEAAAAESEEKLAEVTEEKDNKLRARRIKLGLEQSRPKNEPVEEPKRGQRNQPVRNSRKKKRKGTTPGQFNRDQSGQNWDDAAETQNLSPEEEAEELSRMRAIRRAEARARAAAKRQKKSGKKPRKKKRN